MCCFKTASHHLFMQCEGCFMKSCSLVQFCLSQTLVSSAVWLQIMNEFVKPLAQLRISGLAWLPLYRTGAGPTLLIAALHMWGGEWGWGAQASLSAGFVAKQRFLCTLRHAGNIDSPCNIKYKVNWNISTEIWKVTKTAPAWNANIYQLSSRKSLNKLDLIFLTI